MKFFILICFLPSIISSLEHDVNINNDEDCWSMERNNTFEEFDAVQVKFSPKITFEQNNCSVRINNPWVTNPKNGFGIFLPRVMDCSSILIIDCLSERQYSKQLTCHTTSNKIEMPCNSINLMFKRNVRNQEIKKPIFVQVVALAKGPCNDRDFLFQCPNDYPNSCIDRKLRCNGRSECPDGGDERHCHSSPEPGIPTIVIILIVLGALLLCCVFSAIIACCCCKVALDTCCAAVHRNNAKNGTQVTGIDDAVTQGLVLSTNVADTVPQQTTNTLVTDSIRPIYPPLT